MALDTNVLVRFLVEDDQKQAEQAAAIMDDADTLVLSVVMLVELVWVLTRSYRFSRAEVRRILSELIESDRVEVDRPVIQSALAMFADGGDFADGCILELARAARSDLVTFDKQLVGLSNGSALDAAQLSGELNPERR